MPDGRLVRHRKLHAFEHPAIQPGDEHTVFDTPHGFRAALLICYDNNIVENVRVAALRGAEVLLAPHQTGGCRTTNPHLMGVIDRRLWDERASNPEAIERELRGEKGRGWLMRWLPSRAHDNGLFLVFSNGVGVDDDEVRTGNAMILDPYGRILAETGKAGDDMVVADLDASLLEKATGRLWMQARRPALYGELSVPTGRERDAHQLKFEEYGRPSWTRRPSATCGSRGCCSARTPSAASRTRASIATSGWSTTTRWPGSRRRSSRPSGSASPASSPAPTST